jgi:L-ascorbate metabolism protein UlaG (beta-lactamase superfamily)
MNVRLMASAALVTALCWTGPVAGAQQRRATSPRRDARNPVTLTYLGTAGWEITDGTTVILVDPYLSRIPLLADRSSLGRAESADRRPVDPNTVLVSDTAAADAHVRRADIILLHHAHFDHILDAPYIARKTGATVIGHESSTNVMRGAGLPPSQLITVRGGEDYAFRGVSIRVIPSVHSPLFQKHYYDGRTIPSTIKAPFKLGDLAEGGSLAFLIRLGGHQILTFGSMNYIEREIDGLRPDIVLVGAGESRAEIYDYAGRLMRALGYPDVVLPTHWDNYFIPFSASQDTSIARLQFFVREIRTASPRTRVIIPQYFVPITIPALKQ